MKTLTHFFACLLLALLPLQGMAALPMLACKMASKLSAPAHAMHAQVDGQADVQANMHAQHALPDENSTSQQHGSCQQCGTCCITAAPNQHQTLLEYTDFRVPPPVLRAIAIHSAPIFLPERPPRFA